jgi:methionyl-tRNA formyltransferase
MGLLTTGEDGKRISAAPPRRRLRVHFVTEDDPLYVIRFFDVFFAEYPRDQLEIVGVTVAAPFRETRAATARRILSLYGALGFLRLLKRVAAAKLRRRSIAALARREEISLLPTRSVNDPTYVTSVRALEPDVIVSVAAPELFRHELLSVPRLGCINLHSGRLPTYRGMMPTFWQMLEGERHATVTVHEMAPEVDAGRVLGTVTCAIERRDSVDRVMAEAKIAGARLVIRVLGELATGTATPRRLEMSEAAYYSFPRRHHAADLRRRGHRLL